MFINRSAIRELTTNFNTIFNKTLAETEVQWPKIAMEVKSANESEGYGWLADLPTMREWVGEREIKNIVMHGYTITNKDYEATIGVGRNNIEDDNLGMFAPIFKDLATKAKENPDRLIFELLVKSFENKCYDGSPFISNQHKTELSNNKPIVQSNKGTKKLSAVSYGEARAQMMTIKDCNGKSLKIVPNLLVVSPTNEALAKTLMMAETINGITNIYKGTAEVLVVTELIDTPEAWFLLCTNKTIRPFIYQNRKEPKLVSKTAETDDNVFFEKTYYYGVDSRGNAGYGLWQLAYGSTGEVE